MLAISWIILGLRRNGAGRNPAGRVVWLKTPHASPEGRRANPVPAPPMTRVATLPRLIAVRLLWYAAVGAVALLAFKLHTQFGADVLLTAIAAYVPLSLSFLPVLAWLCGRRRESGRADAQATPVWPGYLAAATGIVMLAGYHVAAAPYLAECGILLLLVAADLWLVRKESAYFLALAG